MVELDYTYPLFRPPSEANSLILQITSGCSHNQCLFCAMYKTKSFMRKPLDKTLFELDNLKNHSVQALRVFLADGDSMGVPTENLITILSKIKESVYGVRRISAYATALNILEKSDEELKSLNENGLDLLYLGLESGSDKVLDLMRKGSTAQQNVEAVLKAKKAGFTVSVMVILGLGGQELWLEHAVETGRIVSLMQPQFLAALTLMLAPGTPLLKNIDKGEFKLLDANEILMEQKKMLEHIKGERIVFRSTHASNYVALKGILDRDTDRLIEQIDRAIENHDFRPDFLRGL